MSAGAYLSECSTDVAAAADNDNLPIHEEKSRGVYVKGLSDFYVGDAGEVYEIMRQGGNARAVSATSKPRLEQSVRLALTRSPQT